MSFGYSADAMPIRIIRACRSALGAIFLGLLVACAATDPASPGDTGDAMLPEARLVEAEAAFDRGDYPAGARMYREAAQRSDDEMIAEQATRAAFDHTQLREAALLLTAGWRSTRPARTRIGTLALSRSSCIDSMTRKRSSVTCSTPSTSARPRGSWRCCP